MNEYKQARKQLQNFCNQEYQFQQIANFLAKRADPAQHEIWLSCIDHQLSCFKHHEEIIQTAEQILPPYLTQKLFIISYNHSQNIIKNQVQFQLN
jgi:hypothetical protein